MEMTTIRVSVDHRTALAALKTHPRETLDEVLGRLLPAALVVIPVKEVIESITPDAQKEAI